MTESRGDVRWDSPLAVAACMCACIAAYGVYLALPLILGALSDLYGFSSREIGWVGAAENAGLLLGSVLVSVVAKSGRFRLLMAAGIATACLGNVMTSFVHTFEPMAAVRLATGFGSGTCYSAGIACLSLARQSSRHFSVFIVALVLMNSLELWLVPAILSNVGLHGLYAGFGAAFLVPLALLPLIPVITLSAAPKSADADERPVAVAHAAGSLVWWCLAGIVLFNVAASAFWAYSERIGSSIGLSQQTVANTLTLCNLFSLTGSVLAYWLSLRWGQHRPQLAALAVMLAVFGTWSMHLTATGYVIGVLIFFEVWSMTQVYQLGTLNEIDRSGQFVALVPAAQGLGQSAGPFIAGLLLGWQWRYSQVFMVMNFFIAGCFGVYLHVYGRLRRIQPRAPG
jgi:MFS family permease